MRFEPNLNCRRKAEEFKSASLDFESAQTTLTGNSYICTLYVRIAKSEARCLYKSSQRLSVRHDMTSFFIFLFLRKFR